MGCDGGSIPRRDEMVKLKKKAEKVRTPICPSALTLYSRDSAVTEVLLSTQADRDVELAARWRHCALSGEELQLPVVACDLGR